MVGTILKERPSIEHMVRMDDIDACITRIGFGSGFRNLLARRKKGHGVIEPPFHNTLLSGAKGTGKTTRAKILAYKYVEIGLAKKEPIGFIDATKLIGKCIGYSENSLTEFMEQAGVVIIDEIDSLLDSHFGINILNHMNAHMGNHVNNPIIIGTCYDTTQEKFLDSVDGLRRRFRHIFPSPEYGFDDYVKIFEKKVEAEGMICGPDVLDVVRELLERVQFGQKNKFGNAGEVKNIFDTTLELHAANLKARGINPDALTEEDLDRDKSLSTITPADIPEFDGKRRIYHAAFGAYIRPETVQDNRPGLGGRGLDRQ